MHYLYRHIRLDYNIPFYIGIGRNSVNSNNYYRSRSTKNRNKHWHNVVNKTNYEVEIMLESDDFEFIKEKEKEFIKIYGRKDMSTGALVNMTDGGEGVLNCICTEETKKKLSSVVFTQERKDYLSNKLKGRKRPEYSGKNHPFFGKKRPEHSERLKGRKFPERSEMFKGSKNPNYGKKHSKETIDIMSKKAKGKYVKEKNPMFGKKRPEVSEKNKELKGKNVINTKTGCIYKSIKEASVHNNIPYSTLKQKLNGKAKNNTNLILVKDA
jgi:hypothetical protein